MSKIPNIFLIGPMGSGKSTIGKQLAKELQMDFYDSDQEIEVRTGVSIPWIFDVEGEVGFRQREHKVLDELTQKSGIIIATGGGAVLSAENRNVLAGRGIVIYLKVSIDEQISRTEKGHNRPLLEKENLRNSLTKLNKERDPYYEEIADFSFETNNRSAQAVVKDIIESVQNKQIGTGGME